MNGKIQSSQPPESRMARVWRVFLDWDRAINTSPFEITLERLEERVSKLEQEGLAFQGPDCAEEINPMSESPVDSVLYKEEALSDELPDAALEVAASKYWERAGNLYTLAFCTGLDSCPLAPRK